MYDKEKFLTWSWLNGDLSFLHHAGQDKIEKAFSEASGILFVIECSRQIGKTVWAVKKCFEMGAKYPGCQMRYATAFETDLKEIVMPAFDFILNFCPEPLRPVFREKDSSWNMWNGSRIKLVGMDRKPHAMRGNKLRLIVYDEAGFTSKLKQSYDAVYPTFTHVPGARAIMMSTPPETPDHEFVTYCERAELEGRYIRLSIYDNPLLSHDRIDDIAKEYGGKSTTHFRREYLCERVVERSKAVIPEFKEDYIQNVEEDLPHRFWHRYVSLDSGVRDQTALLFAYYNWQRAKLVIEDEVAIQGADVTTRRISELTRQKEKELGYTATHRRVADNDNLILLQDLGTEFGLHFNPTSKDQVQAMVNKVRLWFESGRILIHPRCTRLIGCLKSATWNEKRDSFERSKVFGHFDLLAALVYLVRNIDEQTNPIPKDWNVDFSNQLLFINKKACLSEDAKELRNIFCTGNAYDSK